eukprot:145227_1
MAWFHFEMFSYVVWFIIITHAIYSTIKSISFKSNIWLKKRNLFIYYTLNISCIVVIVSFCVFAICCIHSSSFMITLTTIFWTTSVFIWIFIIATKNWMIYYQYKWTFYIKQSQWQQIINPTIIDTLAQQNWFISHHQTFGQFKYIYTLLGTIAICCCIISGLTWSLTAHFMHNYTAHIAISCAITMSMYTPWLLLYVYCVWHTPPLDDAFKIHRESRLHAKALLLTIPNPIISVLYIIITGEMAIPFFLACFIGSIIIYSIVFISTVYIAKELNNNGKCEWQITGDGITLQMVLSNQTTLNLFMNYLSTEYSMEILLSCIEIMQYQSYVKNFMDKHFGSGNQIELLSGIPTSLIIEESAKTDGINIEIDDTDGLNLYNAKIKAHKLYNKYIKENAEFEINISGNMRDILNETLEHLDVLLLDKSVGLKQLYMIFEDSKQEMMTLQSISFERFRAETEFDAVKAVFNVKGRKTSAP